MEVKAWMWVRSKAWYGLLICVLIISLGCKSIEVEGHYATSAIQIDGQMFDWTDIPYTTFDDEGAVLRLCNDQDNLYIYLRLKDAKMARLIRLTGLTLWLDAAGKKREDISLTYYGGPTPEEIGEQPGGSFGGNMPSEMRAKFEKMTAEKENKFIYYNRKKVIEVELPRDGSVGPAVDYDGSRGFFSYEFKIPLSDTLYGLGAVPGREICIGAVWGDLGDLKNTMSERSGGPGGGRGGGKGGGGGRRGGSSGGIRPGGMELPEKQEIWLKTWIIKAPMTEVRSEN